MPKTLKIEIRSFFGFKQKGKEKMSKKLFVISIVALVAALSLATIQSSPVEGKKNACTTIQSGELTASDGSTIEVGFDQWGYNYQARLFNGYYDNYSRPEIPVSEGDKLAMKWNDAWLDNKDCDGDGKLDRYYGYPSYIGSGAWLTNHMSGEYELDGETCKWNYFVKIVAAPADAYVVDGYWYTADGVEIGEVIWGAFAIIQEVENDPCLGLHGLQYLSPVRAGLGGW